MNFFPDRPTLLKEPGVAIVDTVESPKLVRVEYAATTWFAKFYRSDCQTALSPGQEVTVIGIEGITLLITI